MDVEPQIADLKHRLALAEAAIQSLQRGVADETRARERSASDESEARADVERRLAGSMHEVTGRLDTIINAIMGDIKTPDVPGLVHKMNEIRQQQLANQALMVRFEATLLELQRYRATMPSPEDLQKLKEATDAQKSRMTYVMGWTGGVAAVVLILWNVGQVVVGFVLDWAGRK